MHPSLWTDEVFVVCSPFARLLWIGLWTQADDQGVFEWKPITLKMRLLPNDAQDVVALLEELSGHDLVRQFADGDKVFGVVRNFQKFQRPKKPNCVYPFPNQFRTYVGLTAPSGEPVRNQFPTGSELSPQREGRGEEGREGDKREEGGGDSPSALSPTGLRDLWNEGVVNPIAQCRGLSAKRNTAARARLADNPDDAYWLSVIARIARSSFCRGQNDRQWVATFDWLLQPDTSLKVLEGKYDDRPSSKPAASSAIRVVPNPEETRRRYLDDDRKGGAA